MIPEVTKAKATPCRRRIHAAVQAAQLPDTIFTRMQLMDEIWGYDTQTDEHTVSVHINRLGERFSAGRV